MSEFLIGDLVKYSDETTKGIYMIEGIAQWGGSMVGIKIYTLCPIQKGCGRVNTVGSDLTLVSRNNNTHSVTWVDEWSDCEGRATKLLPQLYNKELIESFKKNNPDIQTITLSSKKGKDYTTVVLKSGYKGMVTRHEDDDCDWEKAIVWAYSKALKSRANSLTLALRQCFPWTFQ